MIILKIPDIYDISDDHNIIPDHFDTPDGDNDAWGHLIELDVVQCF